MKLLKPLAGYTLYNHIRNENIRKELKIPVIYWNYWGIRKQLKWTHFENVRPVGNMKTLEDRRSCEGDHFGPEAEQAKGLIHEWYWWI